jgi:hypothetical protein
VLLASKRQNHGWGWIFYLFTARLARVLIAIARIFQLGTSFEELEDQLIGLAPHGAREAAEKW